MFYLNKCKIFKEVDIKTSEVNLFPKNESEACLKKLKIHIIPTPYSDVSKSICTLEIVRVPSILTDSSLPKDYQMTIAMQNENVDCLKDVINIVEKHNRIPDLINLNVGNTLQYGLYYVEKIIVKECYRGEKIGSDVMEILVGIIEKAFGEYPHLITLVSSPIENTSLKPSEAKRKLNDFYERNNFKLFSFSNDPIGVKTT